MSLQTKPIFYLTDVLSFPPLGHFFIAKSYKWSHGSSDNDITTPIFSLTNTGKERDVPMLVLLLAFG